MFAFIFAYAYNQIMSYSPELVKLKRKRIILLAVLASLVVIFFFASLFIGSSHLSFIETIKGLFGLSNNKANIIMQNIRLPRLIAALIAGAGLAIAGTIMQTNLNNPMASPATLGVTNAATLGANIAIIILSGGVVITNNGQQSGASNYYFVTFMAFIFAVLAILLVLGLCNIRSFNSVTVILIGVGLSALFSAITTLIQYFATDVKLAAAVYWSFGDLSRVTMNDNLVLAIILIACFIPMVFLSNSYNALLGGDDLARSLGVKVNFVRIISLILASLITAAIVSFFGIIGFIGIMAPHIVKKIIGTNHRYLLPASALMGIVIIQFSDGLSRLIMQGTSLPVGAVTAIIGAPFFLYIVFSKDRGYKHA